MPPGVAKIHLSLPPRCWDQRRVPPLASLSHFWESTATCTNSHYSRTSTFLAAPHNPHPLWFSMFGVNSCPWGSRDPGEARGGVRKPMEWRRSRNYLATQGRIWRIQEACRGWGRAESGIWETNEVKRSRAYLVVLYIVRHLDIEMQLTLLVTLYPATLLIYFISSWEYVWNLQGRMKS